MGYVVDYVTPKLPEGVLQYLTTAELDRLEELLSMIAGYGAG
jgi:hypothetical protein